MRTSLFSCLSLCLLFMSCEPAATEAAGAVETATAPAAAPVKSIAEVILDRALAAHGQGKYGKAHYQFVFRENTYTFQNDDGNYTYTMTKETGEGTQFDQLKNGSFSRHLNGKPLELTAKEAAVGTEAINSVVYFATLPHKLGDPAVNLMYAGEDTIKSAFYDVLAVNFDQEGGGVDHDDNFRYWINQRTRRIDYLAYDYLTNGGGVRFRSAYNPRVVDGILFQDYVNYKAPVGTALADLPAMYENGTLEKLSVVATENVVSLGEDL